MSSVSEIGMSSRFALKNYIRPLTFAQFASLTSAFYDAACRTFNQECALEISFMSAIKEYGSSEVSDFGRGWEQRTNAERTFAKANSIHDITQQDWEAARFVDVNILPSNPHSSLRHAWANAAFKLPNAKSACFFIEPENRGMAFSHHLRQAQPWMRYTPDIFLSDILRY